MEDTTREKRSALGFSRTWGMAAGRGVKATFESLKTVKTVEAKSFRTADKADCRLLAETFK